MYMNEAKVAKLSDVDLIKLIREDMEMLGDMSGFEESGIKERWEEFFKRIERK